MKTVLLMLSSIFFVFANNCVIPSPLTLQLMIEYAKWRSWDQIVLFDNLSSKSKYNINLIFARVNIFPYCTLYFLRDVSFCEKIINAWHINLLISYKTIAFFFDKGKSIDRALIQIYTTVVKNKFLTVCYCVNKSDTM